MDAVEIIPPTERVNATVRPPGSKSITNRVLPIAAVAKGTSTLTGVLKSDDTLYMIAALKQLSVEIDDSRLSDVPEESVVIVHGCDGRFPATEADLYLGNSGTSIRFLTAMVAACGRGRFRLDGNERMRQRPIGDLVDALRNLGGSLSYEAAAGFPPITVAADRDLKGSTPIRANTSSQFITGLELSRHAVPVPFDWEPKGEIVSLPYVSMTSECIRSFKAVEAGYVGVDYSIEADASAASYWFAYGAVHSAVAVIGVRSDRSIQGDADFAERLAASGSDVRWYEFEGKPSTSVSPLGGQRPSGGIYDFSDISDTAQTMAAVAVYADSPTTVTGVEHMRHKECDRVSAVVTELRKLGIQCDEHTDGYTIYPGTPVCKEPVETYDDHRMAMSFALLGLKTPGIVIKDPDCVNKTYPRFWDDWAKVTGQPVRRFTL